MLPPGSSVLLRHRDLYLAGQSFPVPALRGVGVCPQSLAPVPGRAGVPRAAAGSGTVALSATCASVPPGRSRGEPG